MELHLLQSVIEIQKIKLSLRFPGQLSFLFKGEKIYEDLPKLYPLTNGQCAVATTVSFQIQSSYKYAIQSYEEVMVDLIISVKTASGKIVAGVVSFNMLQDNTIAIPFKRCSDKAATAFLHISYTKVQKLKDLQLTKVKSLVMDTAHIRSASKLTNLSSIKSTENLRNLNRFQSPIKLVHQKEQQFANHQISKDFSFESTSNKAINSKINSMQAGIDSRVRQMQDTYERKLRMIKRQKEEIQTYMERAEQKCKLAERREKQMQIQTKEIVEVSQKRKVRICDLEAKQNQSEKQHIENDKKIKTLQSELKTANQNHSTLFARYTALEKRLEFKEHALNERQKRLESKVTQLESNNTKAIHQYNILLEKMEANEKANKTANKLKDKSHFQEKGKLKDQSERLQKEILRLNQINEELTSKSIGLSAQSKNSFSMYSEIDIEVQILKRNLEDQKIQLEHYKDTNKQMQFQIDSLKSLEEEKSILKKRANELSQENQSLKEKIDKLTSGHNELKQHYNQLAKNAQTIKKEKKDLINKCTELEKTNTQQYIEITKLTSQNNNLSSKNTYLNERLNDLSTKSQQLNDQFADNKAVLVSKYNSLLQSKSYLESDLEDYRWNLQRQKEKSSQAEKKLKQRNETLLKQEEEALKLRRQWENSVILIQEMSVQKAKLYKLIDQLKAKEKEYSQSIKEKESKIYETSKQMKQFQQQNYLSSSSLKNTVAENKKITTTYEGILETLKKELNEKDTSLASAERKCKKLEESIEKNSRQIKILNMSLNQSQKIAKEEEQNGLLVKKRIARLQTELQECQQKLRAESDRYASEINTLKDSVKSTQKQRVVYAEQLQIYKKATQQLLRLISKQDQSINQIEIIAVPSETIAKFQLEAITSRNKYLSKFKSTIATLQVEINDLQLQLQNKSKKIDTLQTQLQAIINQKDKSILNAHKKQEEDKLILENKLTKLTNALAYTKSQKQKIENKYQGLREQHQQKRQQFNELTSNYAQKCQELKITQSKILELRTSTMNSKEEDRLQIQFKNAEQKQEIETYKEKIHELLKNQEALQKSVNNKEKEITSLKSSLISVEDQKLFLSTELERVVQQFKKLKQEKHQMGQKIIQYQKDRQQLKYSLETVQLQACSEKQLKTHNQTKLKQAHEELSNLLIANQTLQNKLQNINKSFSVSGQQQKIKITLLEQHLESQTRKSNNLLNQLNKKNGQLKLTEFQVSQLVQKINNSDSLTNHLRKQNGQKKSEIIRLSSKIDDLHRRLLESEKNRQEYSDQKRSVQQELTIKIQKINQLESTIESIHSDKKRLKNQINDLQKKYDSLNQQKHGLVSNGSQLREVITQMKREIQKLNNLQSQSKTKLSNLQSKLQDQQQIYQTLNNKTWQQSQNQLRRQNQTCLQLQNQLKQKQMERLDMKGEIQMLNQQNEQLQILLQQKEDFIEQQSAEILQLQNRIIALNGELRKCLETWENQKTASLSSSRSYDLIQQSMSKFQQYAHQLNQKTQLVLDISSFITKDEVIAKSSLSLIQLIEMINHSKSRVLSKVGVNDKNLIGKDYDCMREKVEQVLIIQKLSSSKQLL